MKVGIEPGPLADNVGSFSVGGQLNFESVCQMSNKLWCDNPERDNQHHQQRSILDKRPTKNDNEPRECKVDDSW